MSGSAALALVGVLLEVPTVVPPPPMDPLELELSWHAPPGCPSAAEIEQRIRALLPGEPDGAGVLHVEGEVVEVDGGVELTLRSTFGAQHDRRTLQAPSCAELGEATAVLLAIALEPSRAAELGAPPQPPAEPEHPRAADPSASDASVGAASTDDDPTAEARSAAVVDDARSAGAQRSRRPSAGGLRLAGGLEVGAMPLPSGVLQAAALLLWPHARAELRGTWVPPRATRSPPGARFQLGAVGMLGCGQPTRRPLEVPLCLGVEAGATRARLDGATQHRGWVAALASVGVARAWGPVAIWSAAELAGRIVGYRFLDGKDVLLRQHAVSVRVLVGIELRRSWKPAAGGH